MTTTRLVGGKYRLDPAPVGTGGFGVVYLATDESLSPPVRVAIKMLKPDVITNAMAAGRLRREVRIGSGLPHPHLLPVLDDGETPSDGVWYVMPVAQYSLVHRVEAGEISRTELLQILDSVEAGLSHLHAHKTLHRDLSPGNVLFVDGVWVVSDFGLSISEEVAITYRTSSNVGMGTPDFRSPEQFVSLKSAMVRSDVYGFGKLIQYLTERKWPRGAPSIGNNLRDVIAKATREDPESRYGSVLEVLLAVRVLLAKPPTSEVSNADHADRLIDEVMTRERARDEVRWLALLDPSAPDERHLRRAFAGLSNSALRLLWAADPEAFIVAVRNFATALSHADIGYEEVDHPVEAMFRVDAVADHPEIRYIALKTIAELGSANDQWASRRAALKIIMKTREGRLLEPTISALRASGAASWVLQETDVDSLDQPLRGWLRDIDN